MDQNDLLKNIEQRLREAHGARFQGVALFGSEARGESKEDSDIDLLVLLQGPINLWEDVAISVHALYGLQLEIIRPLHALPADADDFAAGKFSLYRKVKAEGIFA